MQTNEWRRIGFKCVLQLWCVIVRKDCTMTDLYCRKCRGSPESRQDVDSESAAPSTKEGVAREESDLAGRRGEVKSERDRCELVFCGKLHRIPATGNIIWSRGIERKTDTV